MPPREASAPGSAGQSTGRRRPGVRTRGPRAPLAPGNSPAPLGALRAPGKGLELQPTHRKPEATVPQVGVERFAGDARLHHHREVLWVYPQDPVHVCQVDADAALVGRVAKELMDLRPPGARPPPIGEVERLSCPPVRSPGGQVRRGGRSHRCDGRGGAYLHGTDSTLKPRARAKWDDGHSLAVAQGGQPADLFHILGPHHSAWRSAPGTRPSAVSAGTVYPRSCSCQRSPKA